jgi:hypothetical protein
MYFKHTAVIPSGWKHNNDIKNGFGRAKRHRQNKMKVQSGS